VLWQPVFWMMPWLNRWSRPSLSNTLGVKLPSGVWVQAAAWLGTAHHAYRSASSPGHFRKSDAECRAPGCPGSACRNHGPSGLEQDGTGWTAIGDVSQLGESGEPWGLLNVAAWAAFSQRQAGAARRRPGLGLRVCIAGVPGNLQVVVGRAIGLPCGMPWRMVYISLSSRS
jgi:hypothetical protein